MGSMEKECNKSFLKSIHIWRQSQWKLSNNRGDRTPTDLSKSNQYLVTSNWVIGQRVRWELPNNSGYFKDCTLPHTIWWEVPTAEKKIYTTQWTWRSEGGTYIEPSNLCNSIFSTRRYSASYQRGEKAQTATQTQILWSTMVYFLRDMLMQCCHQYQNCLKEYFMRWNPYPTLLVCPSIWNYSAQGTMVEANSTVFKKQ